MRTVGLLGGMSWQTTALYYAEINKHVRARLGGIHSASLLLRSFDYAEVAALLAAGDDGGGWDATAELLGDGGRGLKAAGAEGLVLCANVAHRVAGAVEERAGLPLLHIADFAGAAVARAGCARVGLLGTRAVMDQGFYKDRLRARFGLEVVLPSAAFRSAVDGLVFGELGREVVTDEVRGMFRRECEELVERGHADCVLLACTELRMVLRDGDVRVPVFETAALHARGVAEWALAGNGT